MLNPHGLRTALRSALRSFYQHTLDRPIDFVRTRLEAIGQHRLPTAVLCLAVFFGVPYARYTCPAVLVSVDGVVVAAVADDTVVDAALEEITQELSSLDAPTQSLTDAVSTQHSFALRHELHSSTALRERILAQSGALEEVAVIWINDEPALYCDSTDDAQAALDAVKQSYCNGGTDVRASFLEPVAVHMSAAPADWVQDAPAVAAALTDQVHVRIAETVSYTEDIPYQTVTLQNVYMAPDQTHMLQEGTLGQAEVTAQVVTINGQVQEQTIVSRAVLSKAVDQVVEIGAEPTGVGTGLLLPPVTGYRVSSRFQTLERATHHGIDLAVETGTPVFAADNGTVVTSAWSDSFGFYVVLDHGNGLQTLYAHNSALSVAPGMIVEQGQQIALSGNTGNSTGPHLHFEVHLNGTPINPETYVAFSDAAQ